MPTSYWLKNKASPETPSDEGERVSNTSETPKETLTFSDVDSDESDVDDSGPKDLALPVPEPKHIADFFNAVPTKGFPARPQGGNKNGKVQKAAQPWKGFRLPLGEENGISLIVKCPRRTDFGSNGLGGWV